MKKYPSRNRRKRINFSIKGKLQARLLLKIFSIVLISTIICSAVFYFYSNQEVGQSYRLFHVKARNFLDFLLPAVILSFVLSVIAGSFFSLFFPHSIAGPLFRIEKEILSIGKGDLTVNIIIRKGDEVKELADNINVMVKCLREKLVRIKGANEELKQIALKAEDEGILKLKKISQKMSEELKYFHL